jgi:hypothetical protein
MCGQCYATGTVVAETAMLVGAPAAYAVYRRTRRALGLPDTAVAPQAREHEPRTAHDLSLDAPSGVTA